MATAVDRRRVLRGGVAERCRRARERCGVDDGFARQGRGWGQGRDWLCRVGWRHAGSGAVKVLLHGPVYTYIPYESSSKNAQHRLRGSGGFFNLAVLDLCSDFYSDLCGIGAQIEHAKFV